MEQEKTYVWVLSGRFNSEEDNDDFVKVFLNKDKALQEYKDFVKAEKESDFVRGHQNDEDFEVFADFEELDEMNVCLYYFGSCDDSYYTVVKLQRAEVIV